MFNANIRGKVYRVVSKRLGPKDGGFCNPPDQRGKKLGVCSTLRSPAVVLENLIHEVLHACLWDLDESAIEETGEAIARVLLRAGVQVDVKVIHKRLKEVK